MCTSTCRSVEWIHQSKCILISYWKMAGFRAFLGTHWQYKDNFKSTKNIYFWKLFIRNVREFFGSIYLQSLYLTRAWIINWLPKLHHFLSNTAIFFSLKLNIINSGVSYYELIVRRWSSTFPSDEMMSSSFSNSSSSTSVPDSRAEIIVHKIEILD